MTDKAVSPLRQRMIEDMTLRHFAEKARKDYIRYVKAFAAFLGRSPDTATAEDLEEPCESAEYQRRHSWPAMPMSERS
jgi:hypothetical protein